METTTRTWISWRPAILTGLIAGLVFLMLEMVMVPLFLGVSPWAPVRMIGAIVLGQGVLPPPATFDITVFVAAALVHFVLAVIYAIILALIIHRLNMAIALVVGLLFGLGLYLVNFYGFTAQFPWFAEARNWVSIFAHLVFGVVSAWTYKTLAQRDLSTAEHQHEFRERTS